MQSIDESTEAAWINFHLQIPLNVRLYHRLLRAAELEATARSWLHTGILHLQAGEFNGKQVVPAEWIKAIQTPGSIQPNYGYLTWLGTEWQEQRYYNRKTSTNVSHSEEFAADDVIFFDGMGGQRVYIIPSADMVIVRTGEITLDWDDAALPNMLVGGMIP